MAESPPTAHCKKVEPMEKEDKDRMKTPDSISRKRSSDEARGHEYMSIKVKKEKMAHGAEDTNENEFMEVDGECLNLYDDGSFSTMVTSQAMIDLVEESEKEEDDKQEVECQMMATYHHKDIYRIVRKTGGWHYLDGTGQPSVKAMHVPPNAYAAIFCREWEKQGKQTSNTNTGTTVSKKGTDARNNKPNGNLQKKLKRTNTVTPTKGNGNAKKTATQNKDKLWPTPRE